MGLKRDKSVLLTTVSTRTLDEAIVWANKWSKEYEEYNTTIPSTTEPGLFHVTNLYDPGFHWIPMKERLGIAKDQSSR